MWSVKKLVIVSVVDDSTDYGAYLVSKYFTLLVSLPLNLGAIGSVGTVLHQDPRIYNRKD